MINDTRRPYYASVDLPPGSNPSPMSVLVHVLHREKFQDPPQGVCLQPVGDFLPGVLIVTISLVLAR